MFELAMLVFESGFERACEPSPVSQCDLMTSMAYNKLSLVLMRS